ncbi:MAG: hypothetical protein VSS75_024465 [Candidatus Parabeggiatoa sp.]|nr:hypothetical protein [Candidatus Parabeggiatoa sp.]
MKASEPFDDTTKNFYRQLFEGWGLTVETEREVFFRARSIDLVVTGPTSGTSQLQQTLFSYFRQINVLEFKGINDPLTVADYNRIMMRAWGLGGLKTKAAALKKTPAKSVFDELEDNHPKRLPHCRTVTIVCVTRPDKILDDFKNELSFVPTQDSGIYHSPDQKIPQWLIHPSELALEPKNYPLLPLARGKKLEQFIALCIEQGLLDYLQLTMDIGLITDPDVLWHKILEIMQMKPTIHESTRPYIDQFFRTMPEEMWKMPTFREALEDKQRYGQYQGVQITLLNLLRHKFAQIPESVVQKIESTKNLEQLNDWAIQIMTAESLADMGLL